MCKTLRNWHPGAFCASLHNKPGCRGFKGPIPPPLWIRVILFSLRVTLPACFDVVNPCVLQCYRGASKSCHQKQEAMLTRVRRTSFASCSSSRGQMEAGATHAELLVQRSLFSTTCAPEESEFLYSIVQRIGHIAYMAHWFSLLNSHMNKNCSYYSFCWL